MHVALLRGFQPVIENREIKAALPGLELFPREGHKNRVDVNAGEFGNDDVSLRGRSSGGISKFPAENQKRLAVYDELAGTVFKFDVRQFRRMQREHDCTKNDRGDGAAKDKSHKASEKGYGRSQNEMPQRRRKKEQD